MKFIRRNGRIIPIREKSDGNVDQRHVSSKALAEAAAKKKPKASNIGLSAAAGAAAGSAYGLARRDLSRTISGIGLAPGKASKATPLLRRAGKPALLGLLAGAALGSITFTGKQEVANKLKRKAFKKR